MSSTVAFSDQPALPVGVAPVPEPTGRSRTRPSCRHCGAPLLDARMTESGFCCAGCAYVFRLVHEHGLASYYTIKDAVTAPADAAVFQGRDVAWLETAQASAEAAVAATRGRSPQLLLSIQGISCAGCVWLIERLFEQQPGAREIETNAQLGQVRMRWIAGEFSAAAFARTLQSFGYLLGPADGAVTPLESRGLVKRIGLCAAFAMNVMLFAFPSYFGMPRTFVYAPLFSLLAFSFATLSFLVGGTYFVARALRALQQRAVHIDLPIAIGILGAYLGSAYGWIAGEERFVYFDFVATFILLMLIGRWAQVAAVERNQRRLLRQQPKPPVVRLTDGRSVPPEELYAGISFFVEPGQTIPVESRLSDTDAAFSLASISGEPEPRIYRRGQRVPAGAVHVGRAAISLEALQSWDESLLAQLLRTSERPSERHLFLEKIVRGYLIGIIAVAAISGVGWWWHSHDAARTWAVVTAVLVVSCPCAIGLAFPLADEMAIVALRRCGVFVREGDLFAKLMRIRRIVFDKTGTLTLETPVLRNPEAIATLSAGDRCALLALVRDNPHPVSQCLAEHLLSRYADQASAGAIKECVGWGVILDVAGAEAGKRVRWVLGRPDWKDHGAATAVELGDTVFSRDGAVLAEFHFTDEARADALPELRALEERGFAVAIVSGDRVEKVRSLANALHLPESAAVGGMSPQGKADWINAHGADSTLMLGDGANDSLAFERALCRGTPVIHRGMLEQRADFYYLGRGISGIRALFDVDRVRRRTQRHILIFSVAYNLLAVGLAVIGQMSPLVAAVLMPINSLLTLLIVTSGMRPAAAVR